MKNTILTLILIFSFSIAKAQIKIEVSTDKVDDFNGSRIIETDYSFKSGKKRVRGLSDGKYILLSLSYIKSEDQTEQVFLNLRSSYPDTGCLSNYDSKIIFLLKNGEKVELQQISDIECGDIKIARFVFTDNIKGKKMDDYRKEFKENKEILMSSPIDKMRIYYTEGYIDVDLDEKTESVLQAHFEKIDSLINNS